MSKTTNIELNPSLSAITKFETEPKVAFDSIHAILITSNNKVVLVKENGDSFFNLPGGKQKIGENVIQTINRELNEELGLTTSLSYLGNLTIEGKINFGLFIGKIDKTIFNPSLADQGNKIVEIKLVSIEELKIILLNLIPSVAQPIFELLVKHK